MSQIDRAGSVITSLAIKVPCRAATTADINATLTGGNLGYGGGGLFHLDGVSLAEGDRVLVKNQTDQTTNGIWVASALAWTRDVDFDGNRDVTEGTVVVVNDGTVNAGLWFRLTTAGMINFGTSLITFAQTSSPVISATMAPVAAANSIEQAVGLLGVVYPVADVAAVRALTSVAFGGTYVAASGYYASGDGGGGTFWYDATDSTSTDNGGTILVDASGRRWKLVITSGSVTPRQFGARADIVSVSSMGVTIASGSPNLTVTGASFGSGDAGKHIVVPGAGAAGGALETTISSVTDATHVVLATNAGTALTSATAVVFYGTADDPKIQAALNWCIATGTALNVTSGSYLITATLTCAGYVVITGTGYEADAGLFWIGHANLTQASGFKGSAFVCLSTVTGISFATNYAVHVSGLTIQYPTFAAANSNVSGIKLASAGGTTDLQVGSVIDRCWINGADRAIDVTDCYAFWVTNNLITEERTFGIYTNSTASFTQPSYGDWRIAGNQFWAGSVTSPFAHVLLRSGGAGRVTDNKFNTGGSVNTAGTVCVQVSTPPGGPAVSFEPLTITGNSMEGCGVGVSLYQNTGGTSNVSLCTITGNEIWCLNPIVTVDAGSAWIYGLTIMGNTLQAQGTSVSNITLNGVTGAVISGNAFSVYASGSSTALAIGTHCTNIRQRGNVVVSSSVSLLGSFAAPAVPASTVAATNTYPFTVAVYINGGSGNLINRNGAGLFGFSASSFYQTVILEPGDTVSMTYTSAPSWTWEAIAA